MKFTTPGRTAFPTPSSSRLWGNLIATLLFALAPVAGQAAPSYPLVCRGGGGTLGYDGGRATAYFYFSKSGQPAGAGLIAGQCSWVDRAIGAAEPTCLRQSGVQAVAWMFPGRLQNSYYTSTQAPWLRSMLSPSTFQTYQATNPGDGNCFTVTRLGP